MNRKDFLGILWRKAIKPVLILIAVYLIVKFILAVFLEDSSERAIVEISVFFLAIYIGATVAGIILSSLLGLLFSILPPVFKTILRIAVELLFFLIPIAFGVMLFYTWHHDRLIAIAILAYVTISQLYSIIKKEST
ncbi:MAG: hypothetical protein V4613_12870 [Bacteroidota bacterium]